MLFNFDLTSNISSFKCIRIFAYRISITVSWDEGTFWFRKPYAFFYRSQGQVSLGYVVFPFCFKQFVKK